MGENNGQWEPVFSHVLRSYYQNLFYLHIQYVKINNFADDSNELVVLLAAHLVESARHIHMFDIAFGNLDYDPTLKQWCICQ